MVDRRERRVHDLRREEVRVHLLRPHVVEPAHRDEVAEPHVRRLVRDEARAPERLRLRRRLVEQHARRVVEDRARVFHPAELERGHEEEVELPPGIRHARVGLEPVERRGVQVEDRVAVARDLGGVGLAVEHAERARRRASRSRPASRRPRTPSRRSRAAASRRSARVARPFASSRDTSAPFATACHAAGMSSVSVTRALMSG